MTTTDRSVEALEIIQRLLDDVNHIATSAQLESGLDSLSSILTNRDQRDATTFTQQVREVRTFCDVSDAALAVIQLLDRVDHATRWGLGYAGSLIHPDLVPAGEA